MPKVPVSKLKCCLKSCNAKATHLCDDCMCVGYCCSSCRTKDKSSHSAMCRRVARKTKSKSKSRKTSTKRKSKSKSRKTSTKKI